jgi:hypothetical protein
MLQAVSDNLVEQGFSPAVNGNKNSASAAEVLLCKGYSITKMI